MANAPLATHIFLLAVPAAFVERYNDSADVHRVALIDVNLLGDARVGRRNLDGGFIRLDLHKRLIFGDAFAGLDQNADDLRFGDPLA